MSVPRPFKIQIFAAEGVPDGLRFVEKSNWVGLGIVCPRSRYTEVKDRAEFEQSGVYLLVGNEHAADRPTLYIGEGETVRARLNEHHKHKDFWSKAIVFTTKGDPLHKAQIQYLESRLVSRAKERKRCLLENRTDPNMPGLSEADRAEIEGYLEEMLSLLPVLGIRAFEDMAAVTPSQRLFYLNSKDCSAVGFETNDGFAVQKGSQARAASVPSFDPRVLEKRNALVESGILVQEDCGLRFTMDYEFTSPSLASSLVAGRPSNGRTDWKDKAGVTLREHQTQDLS